MDYSNSVILIGEAVVYIRTVLRPYYRWEWKFVRYQTRAIQCPNIPRARTVARLAPRGSIDINEPGTEEASPTAV